jgi:hypothetical protein
MAARHLDLSRAVWRKSSRSSSEGQNCVEVAADLPGIVVIRDSKDRGGGVLVVRCTTWQQLLYSLRVN